MGLTGSPSATCNNQNKRSSAKEIRKHEVNRERVIRGKKNQNGGVVGGGVGGVKNENSRRRD